MSWTVGRIVSDKLKSNEWGSKIVTQLSEYLRTKDPTLKGYSRRNIYNMVMFYDEYSSEVFRDYLQSLPVEIQRKIKAFMRLRAFFHHPVPQFLFRLLPPRWGDNFGYEWARRSRQKEIDNPCPYKGENKEELVLYAKEQELQGRHHDLYVFGHRHIELDLELAGGSRVLVLGDCFRQWTYAQLDKNGNISMQYHETHTR